MKVYTYLCYPPYAGSLQDEAVPDAPWGPEAMRESGISTCVALGASDSGRLPVLETMASSGALLLVNPDTRPTSFFPTGNAPRELDGMSQRMILTAQANGRYPNFGGFCFGWDTTGYAVGQRKGLMVYWGWGDQTESLRNYIARIDQNTLQQFTRRTGLMPVTEAEYISYLLSINAPSLPLRSICPRDSGWRRSHSIPNPWTRPGWPSSRNASTPGPGT